MNAKKISALLQDQIISSKDRAIWLMEHVIKHKGATHLKSHARHLSTVTYYMIDVLVVLAFTALLALFLMLFMIHLLCRRLGYRTQKSFNYFKKEN